MQNTRYNFSIGTLPWWSWLSIIALAGLVCGLVWIGVSFASRAPAALAFPTPILVTVTPGPPPATPQVTGLFKPGNIVQVSGTNGLSLRMRSGPGTLYETVQLVTENMRLEITGEARQADGYLWWPVQTVPASEPGWVVNDYLKIAEP
jgi:hypothetical protein